VAFLDFIRNRQTSAQQSVASTQQAQKPETAKQMYTREAANEKVNRTPVERMPEDQRAKAREIGARLDKATHHLNQEVPAVAPSDGMNNQAAMRQSMTGQERTAPALSPTGGHAGRTPSDTPPVKTPEKARPQTLPRTTPSWER
jgi:hypothetical protein